MKIGDRVRVIKNPIPIRGNVSAVGTLGTIINIDGYLIEVKLDKVYRRNDRYMFYYNELEIVNDLGHRYVE